MPEEVVRIGELSGRVGLSVNWLRQLADAGVIPSTRTAGNHRQFDVTAVRDALARRRDARAERDLVDDPSAVPPQWSRRLSLAGLEEHEVWQLIVRDLALDRSSAAGRIMNYAFTEMLNNALDHSGGTFVDVSFWATLDKLAFRVRDDGVGVFPHLRRGLGLASDLESVQELTKGRRTTFAERHTGEGIFFTSKQVDLFRLSSAGIRWTVDSLRRDHAVGRSDVRSGTEVYAEVDANTSRTTREVFEQFTRDHEFVRTRPAVKLFGLGLTFVSRSEARRVLAGLDPFTEIEVDFTGVDDVGQGFVDELFRVWPQANPDKRIIPVHMNEAVQFMVKRGLPDYDPQGQDHPSA